MPLWFTPPPSQARVCRPCLLLIDQLEVLASRRAGDGADEGVAGRLLACFLQELDAAHDTQQSGFEGLLAAGTHGFGPAALAAVVPASVGGGGLGVFVIGTTERLANLDPAVLQAGRLDYSVEVPLPDRWAGLPRQELVARAADTRGGGGSADRAGPE